MGRGVPMDYRFHLVVVRSRLVVLLVNRHMIPEASDKVVIVSLAK